MGCKASKTATPAAAASGSAMMDGGKLSKSASHQTKESATTALKTKSSSRLSLRNSLGGKAPSLSPQRPSRSGEESMQSAKVYKMLSSSEVTNENMNLEKISSMCTAKNASYVNPQTGCTPLHLACKLLDHSVFTNSTAIGNVAKGDGNNSNKEGTCETGSAQGAAIVALVERLIRLCPEAVHAEDVHEKIPLHYAIAPSVGNERNLTYNDWRVRSGVVRLLLMADLTSSQEYLKLSGVTYDNNHLNTSASTEISNSKSNVSASSSSSKSTKKVKQVPPVVGVTPLYRAIQAIPDDFDSHGPTVEYLSVLRNVIAGVSLSAPNDSDGDQPLALLYRRFTRQFDLAEKFFAGDNSRPEVVQHRLRYKTAAGNTWRMIELLLRPDHPHERWRIVHRAVQVETPPDLLRYIVETNAEDLTVPDEAGNLPLHYAAASKPRHETYSPKNRRNGTSRNHQHYNTYTKYVMDELLYKFPEAASIPNGDGHFALFLAVQAGKPWIGGGIKSLYEAHPAALKQISLAEHSSLQRALSMEGIIGEDYTNDDDEDDDGDILSSGEEDPAAHDEDGNGEKEEKVDEPGAASAVKNNTQIKPGSTPRTKKRMSNTIIRDQPHDAIMRIQQPDIDVQEIITNMWAHEEDAGVQMLGCVAVSKLIKRTLNSSSGSKQDEEKVRKDILRISLTAVAGVVNAMKAHPNEVIVQEKACHALRYMARCDGQCEISFVASGAVAAIVGAMQAHVSDPAVQEQACAAVAEIVRYGGADRATIVASVSGLTAILNAIAAHPDVAGVQREGCIALKELTEYSSASGSSANLPELPQSQTEPLLEAAKERFPVECSEAVNIVLARLTS